MRTGVDRNLTGETRDQAVAADLRVFAVTGIGDVSPGDDLADLIVSAVDCDLGLRHRDCVVVTQKVVSKAENRLVDVDPDDPFSHKPFVESESARVLRRRGQLVISETHHGFVCANAGVDRSNMRRGQASLLPVDSDRSARRIRDRLRVLAGVDVGVVISDSFGRPWRRGITDVAIGCAGIAALIDLRGTSDAMGRELTVTTVAVSDEIAATADLVMGKSANVPVAVVRGLPEHWFREGSVASEIIRPPKEDLFR